MKQRWVSYAMVTALVCGVTDVAAQTFAVEDPVLQAMWVEGMERSQAEPLMQVLLDSIGPRLTGSPGAQAAGDWAVATYTAWGIPARNEQYGTWKGWRRGITHVDLIEPRVRSLEATMLAWSPGTGGMVKAGTVVLPEVESMAELEPWLSTVRGNFVLVSFPEPTCRPNDNWEEYAVEESFEAMRSGRDTAREAWSRRFRALGANDLYRRLEEAGAAGIFTSRWSNGWGVQKIFSASTEQVPTIDLSCEDYGLVYRLTTRGQAPVLQVHADAGFLGDVPVFNTIAEMPGVELPNEYVVLSAHYDSWDGGSGATDNGTGSITMMEAMRILKQAYPNPRRTILVGHWMGEEQGLNGSRAFVKDHPEVVDGLQALFNQDNGTGRVANVSMQGLTGAGASFANWMTHLPSEITQHIRLRVPGTPGGGGSDYAAFICAGAPAFSLSSLSWAYGTYTWHTNRDTFDKVVFDEIKNNATLTAMLTYLASEDPNRVPRDRRVMPVSARTGQQRTWPECRDGRRAFERR